MLLGLEVLHERLQATALRVGEPPADAGDLRVRREDEEAARQRDLRGEPGALAADRVLRHLDQDRLAVLQHVLDPGRGALEILGRPVHLAGVQDGVATATDVDERRLHPREDVLDAAEVHVADHRPGAGTGDVVLDELARLQHRDLVALTVLRDHHQLVGDPGHDRHRLAPATHRRPALPLAAQPRRRGAARSPPSSVRPWPSSAARSSSAWWSSRRWTCAWGPTPVRPRPRPPRSRPPAWPCSGLVRRANGGGGSRSWFRSFPPSSLCRSLGGLAVRRLGHGLRGRLGLRGHGVARGRGPRTRSAPASAATAARTPARAGRAWAGIRALDLARLGVQIDLGLLVRLRGRALPRGARASRRWGVAVGRGRSLRRVAPILGRAAVTGRGAGTGAGTRAPAPAATSAAAPPAPASTRTRRGASAPAGPGPRRTTIGGTRRLDRFGDLRPGGSRTRVVVHRRSLRLGRGDGGARRADGVGRVRTPGRAWGRDGLAGRPGLVGWTHGPGDVVPLTLRRFVAHAESPVLGGLFRPRPSGFGPGAGVAGASPLLTSPVPRGPMAATRRANLVPRIPDADGPERHLGQERSIVPGPARAD